MTGKPSRPSSRDCSRELSRLYLVKPLVIGSLSLFWIAYGLIVLTASFDAASSILIENRFARPLAEGITVLTGITDILLGIAISWRESCRAGLIVGIALSLFCMASVAVITRPLWLEQSRALVKTGPAIILCLLPLSS